MDVPQESCDLNPQEFCRHQRRLVPHLEPVEECRPQPKETCTINFSSPKLTPRPLKKKWCFEEGNEVQAESKPQGQQPQYQRPQIQKNPQAQQPKYQGTPTQQKAKAQQPQYQRFGTQEKPSRPSTSSVSRRPSTPKPKTYLPSYNNGAALNLQSKQKPPQPQYQRPRVQEKPSIPSASSGSRRPSSPKPKTYLPSYNKDAAVSSQVYYKPLKHQKSARLSSTKPPIRSTTARPIANPSPGKARTKPASTGKAQTVRPNNLRPSKQSTPRPRPQRPRRPQSSRKGIPLFRDPAQTIFGTIRTTAKPRRQPAPTKISSRRKPQTTARRQLARKPKFDQNFNKKRPTDAVENRPTKANLRYLPEEKKAPEVVKEEEGKVEDVKGSPKERSKIQPEKEDTEQDSDSNEIPGYILTFKGGSETRNIIDQHVSSEKKKEEVSVSYEGKLQSESEEEQYLRDQFKDPDVSFGLFRPSTKKRTETKTETTVKPEEPKNTYQTSNQDLTLAGFEPSIAVPDAPVVDPTPAAPVSSLPRPEPERGSSGFPKLKQVSCSMVPYPVPLSIS